MATDTTQPTRSGIVPYRLTVRQFERMIDAGIFPERARVELLGGVLVDKMTKNDPHDFAIFRLGYALRGILPTDWYVREEKSVVLGRFWRPEPDIAVVRGPMDRYVKAPRTEDIGLLVEVSETTYAADRGVKWRRFAAVGIPSYGILNLPKRQFELFTDPSGRGRSASYRAAMIHGESDEVPVVIDGRELGRIAIKDLLT